LQQELTMHRHPSRVTTLASAFVWITTAAAALTGCSTTEEGTAPGDSVLVAGTDHVVWKSAGDGYGPEIPPGAACHFEASYDVSLKSGTLAWRVCRFSGTDYTDPAAFAVDESSRPLSATELAQARAAIGAVRVTDGNSCGADRPSVSLEVNSASGQTVYGDDFYGCLKLYQHYVKSGDLDALSGVLDGMAHP
jgi:hypothetical protein